MSMTPRGYERFSTLSAEQQNILSQLLPQLLGRAQGMDMGAFEAPYKRQFEQEIIPGLAERFAGLGAGSQSSSAFQQALGQAGAGLTENLAMLREQQQQNALQSLAQLLGIPMEGLVKKGLGLGQRFGQAGAGALGGAASGALAGSVIPGIGTGLGAGLGALAGGAKGFFS